MTIPFTKAHGAGNDFLLTWTEDAPARDLPDVARAICARHTGVGADGWMLVDANELAIRLFNADGSEPEISGNGTRCAAALLYHTGRVSGDAIRIRTGAGVKELRLLERSGLLYTFEMNMGQPRGDEVRRIPTALGTVEATLLDVGNPQAAILAPEFPAEWRELGAVIERHPMFPNRTNVSFVRVLDEHTIDVVFYERGVGETMSSGTGSTGAAAAAILRGLAKSPVRIVTPAGDLHFRWTDSAWLTGPAEITATGQYLTHT
ncbi:MAG: diaminopimelate epimerase [Bryobacteraceae bacterium]|jgi:diaminopimelate epimerase